MRRRAGRILLIPCVLSAVAAGGCAGAGLAAVGPLWSAIQVVTDRSVERTLPADLPLAWSATVDAFTRMGIRPRDANRSGEPWVLRGDGDTVTVRAELARVTASMTRLSLTVEAGRIGADKHTGGEILNQVVASLAAHNVAARHETAPDRGASSDALAALEAEVRRLRFEIEQGRPVSGPASDRPLAPPVVISNGVVTIPESYGLSTTAMPGAEPSQPAWRPDTPAPVLVEVTPRRGDDMLAGPLKPAGTLVPVQPLRGGRTSE